MAGFLRRLFGKTETRAAMPFFGMGRGGRVFVDTMAAENLSATTACVNAIASGMASLPAFVYQSAADGRIEAPNHPVSRLIRRPNPRQTWPDFVEWLMASVLLNGNAIAAIDTDGAGRVVGLFPIPWQYVTVIMLPSGSVAFDVVAYPSPWGGSGQPRRYLESDLLWIKDRSDDGVLGRSRISRAPDVLASAIGLQSYSSAIWDNVATPSGVVNLPPKISHEGVQRMRASFEDQHTGTANAKRVLMLDAGSTWTPMSVSPEDAEVLASRRFSVEELCRLFNVPPPIVQDYTHNTFTNSAQASLWFASNTLAPWARKIEAEFARSIFTDGSYQLELDLSGLMRGDYTARWAANVAAVSAGILTADEVREMEGFNPLPKAPTPPAADPAASDPAVVDPIEGDA